MVLYPDNANEDTTSWIMQLYSNGRRTISCLQACWLLQTHFIDIKLDIKREQASVQWFLDHSLCGIIWDVKNNVLSFELNKRRPVSEFNLMTCRIR